MRIAILPFTNSKPGKSNAKNYHRWPEVVRMLKVAGHHTTQIAISEDDDIGCDGRIVNPNHDKIVETLSQHDTWATIDSFLQHLAAAFTPDKVGTVVFGPSDPRIFGHGHNNNVIAQPTRLREDQFAFWHDVKHDPEAFPTPEAVFHAIIDAATRNMKR
jgi:hypothetical protein